MTNVPESAFFRGSPEKSNNFKKPAIFGNDWQYLVARYDFWWRELRWLSSLSIIEWE
jgi:hypothetical protein